VYFSKIKTNNINRIITEKEGNMRKGIDVLKVHSEGITASAGRFPDESKVLPKTSTEVRQGSSKLGTGNVFLGDVFKDYT
jgi:hypothetical protein